MKLYLRETEPGLTVWVREPNGARRELPALRLVTFANLLRALRPGPAAARYAMPTALVDTGAYCSLVGERLWSLFRPGFATPLPFDPQTPAHLRTVTIAGGTYPFTLAEVRFDLQDLDLNVLPVVLIAKFVHDGGRLPLALVLGLRGGLLEERTSTAVADPGAPHGQSWAVSAP